MLFGTMQAKNSTLLIGDVEVHTLLKDYGSPLYVYDLSYMKQAMERYQSSFTSSMFQTRVAYASKAFLTKAMVRLLQSYQMSLDVVSPGELYTAMVADFDMKNVIVHGNNKAMEELQFYLNQKVGYIVVDNIQELDHIIAIAKEKNQRVSTLLRVNPGVEAHTHEYIITAKHTSKFGESIFDTDTIDTIMMRYQAQDLVTLEGFHCHIGSQVFDVTSYQKTIEAMTTFIQAIEQTYDRTIQTLNLGGGFGVYYTEGDTNLAIETITSTIIEAVEERVASNQLHINELIIEPGRSIVANAGTTLYTVGYTKHTFGGTNYVFVDGGMSDNIRPALYQAVYHAYLANKMTEEATQVYTVAGKLCESGDVLIRNIKLPKASEGDILAIPSTGAYTYSMSSNYNRILKPAIVFVEDGNVELVVKRETNEDLVRNDL
jgi:diaminopimelate decarboxylase